jgi:outer membrane protein OmpA-like peptidoglycan-associated protein
MKHLLYILALCTATIFVSSCKITDKVTTFAVDSIITAPGEIPIRDLSRMHIDSSAFRVTEVWQYRWFRKQPSLSEKMQLLAEKAVIDANAVEIINPTFIYRRAPFRTRTLYMTGNYVYFPEGGREAPVLRQEVSTSVVTSDEMLMAIFFPFNSDKILPQSLINIKFYAEQIIANPSLQYEVVGYADINTGSYEYNLRLSERRAQTVVNKLKDYGVPDGQISLRVGDIKNAPYKRGDLNYIVIIKPKDKEIPASI